MNRDVLHTQKLQKVLWIHLCPVNQRVSKEKQRNFRKLEAKLEFWLEHENYRPFQTGLTSLKVLTPFANRIVLWFVEQLGLKLSKFTMDDNNTYYHVNGVKKRTYAVKANPDILQFKVRDSEKGRSADQLLQAALKKVRGKDHNYFHL